MRLALDASGLGMWSWEAAANGFSADARCREICGYDPVAELSLESATERVHPERGTAPTSGRSEHRQRAN